MKTYLIFNRKTGQIIHSHTQPHDLEASREELLHLVDGQHEHRDLDIVPADGISPDKFYRVNPKTRQLEETAAKENQAIAMASAQAADLPSPPYGVKTLYLGDKR